MKIRLYFYYDIITEQVTTAWTKAQCFTSGKIVSRSFYDDDYDSYLKALASAKKALL